MKRMKQTIVLVSFCKLTFLFVTSIYSYYSEKIPFTVQKQIVSVYANLPVQVKQIERLQWAKLLLHCSDTSLRSIIIPFFYKSVEMLETNGCSVSNLKLALILFCSVNNW